ncbi:glycosyltransferase family 2 protein [Chryseobacterium sp.]|uniref:glycosyltransferase family 2 protein n=1 Tax=Chryseobacterium sp. TaxID=1871047 RepID=UPI002FC732F6
MKFSILIANYNNGKYFKDCYNSIISQNYDDWEAIIVDDNSTDDSVSVIKDLIKNDLRFSFFKMDQNKGCGAAKRKCAELATGEILAFLDPDDAITPDALQVTVDEYLKHKNIIATYSKIMFCDKDLHPKYSDEKIKQVYNYSKFFNCPIQINHFFSFKKEVYDKTEGINPKLSSAVDQDLYLKLLDHGNPKFIPTNLYLYRRHPSGISQDKSKNKSKDNFAKVILDTMKRRKISEINGKKIPDSFTDSKEIFSLLDYQNSIPYRIQKNLTLFIQQLFNL